MRGLVRSYESGLFEDPQRLAHGRPADASLASDRDLRGQPVAFRQLAGQDPRPDLARELLVGPRDRRSGGR